MSRKTDRCKSNTHLIDVYQVVKDEFGFEHERKLGTIARVLHYRVAGNGAGYYSVLFDNALFRVRSVEYRDNYYILAYRPLSDKVVWYVGVGAIIKVSPYAGIERGRVGRVLEWHEPRVNSPRLKRDTYGRVIVNDVVFTSEDMHKWSVCEDVKDKSLFAVPNWAKMPHQGELDV
jgi:hypothetical protein